MAFDPAPRRALIHQAFRAAVVLGAVALGRRAGAVTAEPGRAAHHGRGVFRNPGLAEHMDARRGMRDLLRWQLGFGPDEPPAIAAARVPAWAPAYAEPDLAALRMPADPANWQVTWVGHSTFLVQHRGVNILTDPVFSERASPVRFAGPRRLSRPGLALRDLPPIDLVLISHNHYDHLDEATIVELGDRPRYLVPLGLGRWFAARGIGRVSECDWWQELDAGPFRATCVPAQHFSGRSIDDTNRTLWCGWVLGAAEGNCYFAGDTGYDAAMFGAIGARTGPMRVSLIPIGAYRPRWFMRPMHVDPHEAVRIHRDVGSARSFGMHWGTFKLTDEPMAEPPLVLAQAVREAGLAADAFTTLRLGGTARA